MVSVVLYSILTAQARKPLRSKHCRTCHRCVAKFDQCVRHSLRSLTPVIAHGYGIAVRGVWRGHS